MEEAIEIMQYIQKQKKDRNTLNLIEYGDYVIFKPRKIPLFGKYWDKMIYTGRDVFKVCSVDKFGKRVQVAFPGNKKIEGVLINSMYPIDHLEGYISMPPFAIWSFLNSCPSYKFYETVITKWNKPTYVMLNSCLIDCLKNQCKGEFSKEKFTIITLDGDLFKIDIDLLISFQGKWLEVLLCQDCRGTLLVKYEDKQISIPKVFISRWKKEKTEYNETIDLSVKVEIKPNLY